MKFLFTIIHFNKSQSLILTEYYVYYCKNFQQDLITIKT